jgi:hypothetical protein
VVSEPSVLLSTPVVVVVAVAPVGAVSIHVSPRIHKMAYNIIIPTLNFGDFSS